MKQLQELTQDDWRPVRGTVTLLKIFAILMLVVCISCEVMLILSGAWYEGRWFLFVPAFGLLISYFIICYPYRWFPFDARKGVKVVEDTKVLRVKKLGWFDTDAGGGMSNTLFGSIFYLYIPDESRRSGKQKMRIKMRAYRYLRPGDEIRIEYLPKSGIILSIDCGTFHYVPWKKKLQPS